jgi:hypothetical protein
MFVKLQCSRFDVSSTTMNFISLSNKLTLQNAELHFFYLDLGYNDYLYIFDFLISISSTLNQWLLFDTLTMLVYIVFHSLFTISLISPIVWDLSLLVISTRMTTCLLSYIHYFSHPYYPIRFEYI